MCVYIYTYIWHSFMALLVQRLTSTALLLQKFKYGHLRRGFSRDVLAKKKKMYCSRDVCEKKKLTPWGGSSPELYGYIFACAQLGIEHTGVWDRHKKNREKNTDTWGGVLQRCMLKKGKKTDTWGGGSPEMYGYIFASAQLGIKHTVSDRAQEIVGFNKVL